MLFSVEIRCRISQLGGYAMEKTNNDQPNFPIGDCRIQRAVYVGAGICLSDCRAQDPRVLFQAAADGWIDRLVYWLGGCDLFRQSI